MGGHHGPEPPKVPDWKIYKVEDVPELMQVKRALAQHGLSDPWLRNEVWKYTEFKYKHYTFWKSLKFFMSRGIKYGVPAGILTAVIEHTVFPIRNPYGDSHEHH